MKLLSKFNVSNDGGPRKFSFELTMSGLVSLGIVLVLGVSWVFILGILVGRGYRPEEAVPELAQIMPTSETPATLESSTPPTVLKPEELQFMSDLQNKTGSAETITVDSTQKPHPPKPALPGGASGGLSGRDLTDAPGTAASAPRPAAVPPPAQSALAKPAPPIPPTPSVKPAPATPAAPEPTLAARTPTPPAATRPEPTPPAAAPAAGGSFEATYQVASFYKKDQADAMVKKLAAKGFKAEIRQAKIQDKEVFRIAVTLRGTEQEIKAGLEKTGEKGSILLGKKTL